MIELIVGIRRPITSACKEAERLGTIDGWKPGVFANKIAQIPTMHGMERANPSIMEGSTNMAA